MIAGFKHTNNHSSSAAAVPREGAPDEGSGGACHTRDQGPHREGSALSGVHARALSNCETRSL